MVAVFVFEKDLLSAKQTLAIRAGSRTRSVSPWLVDSARRLRLVLDQETFLSLTTTEED
jgi:hypothetical protein